MRIKILLFLLSFLVSSNLAQNSLTADITKIEIDLPFEAGHPKFVSDDSGIIFTTPNYKGLYIYKFDSQRTDIISEENGAGYNPLLAGNNGLFFRTFKFKKGKKFYSVRSYNISSGAETIILEEKRSLKLPSQKYSESISLISDSKIITKKMEGTPLQPNLTNRSVYSADNDLILVENQRTNILNPLGKGVYVWESLSPDGKNILFTFSNKGSFICDLNGNIILEIPNAHFPRFSPDGLHISFMIDEDDGERYTASDIYIYSIETGKIFQITNTADKIEMYAEWSNDGKSLIYHTTEGEIYLADIQFEN